MTINIALLGPGRIAENSLVPGLARVPGARLWSILSRDLGRARAFADRHSAGSPEPAHDRLDTLLSDEALDAVLIATPDKQHAEQAVAAAEAGKHVLVEKPMVTDRASGRQVIDACRAANVKLGVAYHMRWHAGHRKLHQTVQSGTLGELRHMRVQWTFKSTDATDWRASPEVGRWWGLAGVGTHCLDQIRWFMRPTCGEVLEMRSTVSRAVFDTPHDETAVVSLMFESGATAALCSSVLFAAPTRMEVYGSDGHANCVGTLGAHGGGNIELNGERFEFEPSDPYAGEIGDFVDAVANDRPPEVDGEEGLANVDLLLEMA